MEGAASMLRNIAEEARPRRCDKTSTAATIVFVTSLVSNRCSNFVHHSRDSRGTCWSKRSTCKNHQSSMHTVDSTSAARDPLLRTNTRFATESLWSQGQHETTAANDHLNSQHPGSPKNEVTRCKRGRPHRNHLGQPCCLFLEKNLNQRQRQEQPKMYHVK